jgi:hypothetical protein
MSSDEGKPPVDNETILFTLDQLSQTVEVMNKVINRLRGYVHQNMTAERQGELRFDRDSSQNGPAGLH